ncbi:MAG TPA: hypothetical protein VGD05_07595 [Pyrinomonadaceae bacterium]
MSEQLYTVDQVSNILGFGFFVGVALGSVVTIIAGWLSEKCVDFVSRKLKNKENR